MRIDWEAPTNCWTEAEEALRVALPKMVNFRDIVDTVDTEEAARHVFTDYWPDPLGIGSEDGETKTRGDHEQLLGGAMIYQQPQDSYSFSVIAGQPRTAGVVNFRIRRVVRQQDEDDLAAVERWLKNRVGALIKELHDYWRSKGGLTLRQAIVTEAPYHNSENNIPQEGDIHECEVRIIWGHQQ